jgi:hypothetical protein
MKRCMILVISCFILIAPVYAGLEEPDHSSIPGYGLVMSNGMTLKITGYAIDLERETITFKSHHSGLTATFPLERIKKVVRADLNIVEVPDTAPTLYENTNSLSDIEDDGGIPILFKVKAVTVGSGSGGYNSSVRKGSTRQGSTSGSSSSSRSSSNYNSSRSSQFGSAGSRTSNTSRSSISGSSTSRSGSSSAEDLFSRIFGGK